METFTYEEYDLLRLDVEEAVERMGDRETYLEIAHYFAAHLPASIAGLKGALQSGDQQTATRMAHSLKSNCATVGAEKIRERCYALEKLCREGAMGMGRELFADLEPHLLAMQARLEALS